MKNKRKSQDAPKKPSKKEIEKEVKRQRGIAKNIIFPILLTHAKSIKQAQTMIKVVVAGMDAVFMQKMQEFSKQRSESPLAELNLLEFMNNDKEYKGEKELVVALSNERLGDAKGLLEGMGKELERLVDKELTERKLETLKTEFLD